MVFSGKPSPGCANCRRSKKRCSLDRPACTRCIKQKVECKGYRETTDLVFRHESVALQHRLKQKTARVRVVSEVVAVGASKPVTQPERKVDISAQIIYGTDVDGMISPKLESPTGSQSSLDDPKEQQDKMKDHLLSGIEQQASYDFTKTELSTAASYPAASIAAQWQPNPDDVATTYFFVNFTSDEHWSFLRECVHEVLADPCLDFAIRACGMAVLANLHPIKRGHEYAQLLYGRAVALLNLALCDGDRSLRDETLMAVRILGYYENITCNRSQSVESWAAHMDGAALLLKLRGKGQFLSETGRALFRDTRQQILGYCIFRDLEPPLHLLDLQAELDLHTPSQYQAYYKTADYMATLSYDYAQLRSKIYAGSMPDGVAVRMVEDLERRHVGWASSARLYESVWAYEQCKVDDNEHVWEGRIFKYSRYAVPHVWNIWRCQRIMIARTRELLSRRVTLTPEERERTAQHCRQVRARMTDEICATVPARLGHAATGGGMCVLMGAYGSVFPLFLAATCLLERTGYVARMLGDGSPPLPTLMHAAAFAQMTWVLGRLRYIFEQVGVGWASRVARPLRWDIKVRKNTSSSIIESWKLDITTAHSNKSWLRKIGEESDQSTACIS